ncbi:MAG: asparagine--tRNA ligase, partial [Gammaproteobacteria bacterium]|nr:asparagine--tRNA ligase [Gammaproteobacteria bacterium]
MDGAATTPRSRVAALLAAAAPLDTLHARGWVRTRRDAKGVSFIELNDGSCLASIQVVVDQSDGADGMAGVSTGAAIAVDGRLVESPGKGQRWEVQADRVTLVGGCPPEYPLQKKRHSDEYLRTIAHLRSRTNKYGAAFRIRSRLSWAIHDFFQSRGFHYIHTPIITGSDCEGAGEMFRVTTLDLDAPPRRDGKVDMDEDFFGREAHLTVSGQLSVETCCMGLGDVYTFGPTFRSENSNTSRHMAEFWMIEPEMAFADLGDDMNLAEDMVKSLIDFLFEDCREDLELFGRFVDKELLKRLEGVRESTFERLPYG